MRDAGEFFMMFLVCLFACLFIVAIHIGEKNRQQAEQAQERAAALQNELENCRFYLQTTKPDSTKWQ